MGPQVQFKRGFIVYSDGNEKNVIVSPHSGPALESSTSRAIKRKLFYAQHVPIRRILKIPKAKPNTRKQFYLSRYNSG